MSTTYYEEIMRLAPLGYWPLADAVGSTVAKDVSGNGRNGTVTGSGLSFMHTPLLKASTLHSAAWDGSVNDSYIVCPSFTLTSWSYVGWGILIGSGAVGSGAYGEMMGDTAATYPRLLINISTPFLLIQGTSGSNSYSTGHIVLGSIIQIALVYNGTSLNIYINGAFDSSHAVSDLAWPSTLAFGSDIGNYCWYGQMAHHALLSQNLTKDQIGRLYNVGRGAGGIMRSGHRAFGRVL